MVPDDSGIVNTYGRLLGGVRVSQTRSSTVASCGASPYADVIAAVVGETTCYPWDTESSESYGDEALMYADVEKPGELVAVCEGVSTESDPDPATWRVFLPEGESTATGDSEAICNATGLLVTLSAISNATRVVSVNVTTAFRPRTPAGLLGGQNPYLLASTVSTGPDRQLPNVNDPFSWTFDYYSRSASESLATLQGAGWVDDATKRVNILFAVVNLELGYWGRVLISSVFTRGGRVTSSATVRSLPIDPYRAQPGLGFLDFLIAAYVVLYWVQTLQHLLKKVRRSRKALADGHGWASALRFMSEPWLILDVSTGVGFVVTMALWARAAATLAYTRAAIVGASWEPASVADSTFVAHAWIEAAARDFYDFKVLGTATLALFMCRLFWQFSLQPKLAVITETLSRGCSDIAHFSVLFSVVLIFYGVWGHIFFGGQIDRWRTPWDSCWAIIAWVAYEYDLTVSELTVGVRAHEYDHAVPPSGTVLLPCIPPPYQPTAHSAPSSPAPCMPCSTCKLLTTRTPRFSSDRSCSSSPTCCCGCSSPSCSTSTGETARTWLSLCRKSALPPTQLPTLALFGTNHPPSVLLAIFAHAHTHCSEVRSEVSSMPSAYDDLLSGGRALPNKLRRVTASMRRGAGKLGFGSSGASGGKGGLMSSRQQRSDSHDEEDSRSSPSYRSSRRLDGGGGSSGNKVSARRVAELLASEAFSERDYVTIGDIAASMRRSLPDVVRFLARFIELPSDLEARARAAHEGGQANARSTVGGSSTGSAGTGGAGGGGGAGKFSFSAMSGMPTAAGGGSGGVGGGSPARPSGRTAAAAAPAANSQDASNDDDDDGSDSDAGRRSGSIDRLAGTVHMPPAISRASTLAAQPMADNRAAINPLQAAARRPAQTRPAPALPAVPGSPPPPPVAVTVAPPTERPASRSDEEDDGSDDDDDSRRDSPVAFSSATRNRIDSTASQPVQPPVAPVPSQPAYGGGQQSWALYGSAAAASAPMPPPGARRPPAAPARPL